ncbi:hypothetical protein Ctob_011360 [Chrysochromulina tobinii]|uniref:Uncharacterized protein n=1 Tax=Chrysochromulina tobinii TaxID=1460289 RepID=A0A0M0JNE4_9EUKA|nr:hypothetical protein Ctob_011360 [Chrysochromulina tobinii]|eukprot:KOO27842.1 hypothetical protein Ctob_011360 [Chrysochromulina sp. CCMP291]
MTVTSGAGAGVMAREKSREVCANEKGEGAGATEKAAEMGGGAGTAEKATEKGEGTGAAEKGEGAGAAGACGSSTSKTAIASSA